MLCWLRFLCLAVLVIGWMFRKGSLPPIAESGAEVLTFVRVDTLDAVPKLALGRGLTGRDWPLW